MTTDDVAVGDIWQSVRQKHFGLTVEVVDVRPQGVNVRIIRGGASQNPRKVRNKPMHIGRTVFTAHYARVSDQRPTEHLFPIQENAIRTMMTSTLEAPAASAVKATPQAEETYDFDAPDMLERTVKALKKWGGRPVRSHVIGQFVHRDLNAERTRQLIDYGVRLGILESWTTPVGPHRPNMLTRYVGLPGQPREPLLPSGLYPGIQVPDEKTSSAAPAPMEKANQALTSIQKQYTALSDATKDEIAELAAANTNTQELQKAYHVMGGVIGMIKRERGIPIAGDNVKHRAPKPPKATAAKPEPRVRTAAAKPEPTPAKASLSFEVTVLKMVPQAVTVTIHATSFGAAEQAALAAEHVVEVLSVSKVTGGAA